MIIPLEIPKRTILEFFPNFTSTDSIFQKMVTLGAPWSDTVSLDMDLVYFTAYSGVKNASAFVKLNTSNGIVDSTTIARVLFSMYGETWKRLWDAYVLEYNPINNYNLNETVKTEKDDTRNISREINSNGTSQTDTTQDSETNDTINSTTNYGKVVNTDGTDKHSVWGYNSTDAVEANQDDHNNEETNSGSDSTNTTEKETVQSTGKVEGTTTDKSTETTEDTLNGEENITRERSGNVGQNSYQDLLRQEFELWKWNFYSRVFEDCDKLLCLAFFEYGCH